MRRAVAAVLALAGLLAACRSTPAKVVTVAIAGRPSAVTVAGGLVWVADDQRGVVVTIDEKKGRVVGAPIKVGPSPIALAADAQTVWVAGADGTLRGISIRDKRVNVEVPSTGGALSAVAVADAVVWLTDVEHGVVTATRLTDRPDTPPNQVAVPNGAVRIAVDGPQIWVTNNDHTVTQIDATTRLPKPPVTVGNGPIGLAVRNGVVWVANSDDDSVSRIPARPQTGPVPATKVGKGPVGVAAGGDGAWVISQDARELTRLALATGKVVATSAIDTRARGVALGTDRVWIAGVDPDVVIGVLRSALGG